jgi:transposase-like protein
VITLLWKVRGTVGVKAQLDETSSYEILRALRWPNGIVCPYCEQMRVTTHTKSIRTPRRRYLCIGCRRTFTDLTGTPFAHTNLPLSVWLLSLRLIGEGVATSELAKALDVKWDTAVHLQRRLAMPLSRPGLIRRLIEAL